MNLMKIGIPLNTLEYTRYNPIESLGARSKNPLVYHEALLEQSIRKNQVELHVKQDLLTKNNDNRRNLLNYILYC